jgi:copper chaperone CopZ
MNTTKFLLSNLNCEACAKVSQMKIGKIEGVTKVEVSSRGNEADGVLEAEREVSLDEIQGALEGTVYKVSAAQ